jgi:uncharacterized protein
LATKRKRKRRGHRGPLMAAAGLAIVAVAAFGLALGMRTAPEPKRAAPHRVETARLAAPSMIRSPPTARREPMWQTPFATQPVAPSQAERPAWLAYAVPSPPVEGRPMVAVVIDDMGVNRAMSARAVRLPAGVTLSYLPYANDIASQAAEARARGHELIVHVPMAPEGMENPGPNALSPSLAPAEIERRLDWALGRFSGYVGINNHEGSKFTADATAMDVVLGALKRRGLLFLDSRTTPRTVGPAIAHRLGLPFAQRNVFLDNVESVAAVERQLAALEAVARRDGAAVAIGHPKAATLEALAPWLESLARRGLVLVPLSAIVARNMAREAARG